MRFLFTHKTYNLISPFNFVFFPFPKQQMTGLHFAFWFSCATLLSVENRISLFCAMLDPPCLMPFVLLGSSSLPPAKGKADIAWPGLKSPFSSSDGLVYCSGGSFHPKIPHCRGGSTCTAAFTPQCHHGMCLWKGTPAQVSALHPSFPEGSAQHTALARLSLGGWDKNLLSLLWFRCLPWRRKRKTLVGEQGKKEKGLPSPLRENRWCKGALGETKSGKCKARTGWKWGWKT